MEYYDIFIFIQLTKYERYEKNSHLSPTRIPGKTSSDILWTLRGILGLRSGSRTAVSSHTSSPTVQYLKTGKYVVTCQHQHSSGSYKTGLQNHIPRLEMIMRFSHLRIRYFLLIQLTVINKTVDHNLDNL